MHVAQLYALCSTMKNRDWYRKIGLDTASRILVQWAHVSDEESLLRESSAPRQNPVYFHWLLDFVLLRGRDQECVGTDDVITSWCLTSGRNRPTWHCCSKTRHSWRHGISLPRNNVIHCERVNRQSKAMNMYFNHRWSREGGNSENRNTFCRHV
jgi:hypothetical protein